jgi:RNA polymerase sigma-70 factor (ECF subfamily)
VLRNKIVDFYRRNARRPLTLATDMESHLEHSLEGEISWIDNRANDRDTFDPDVATERAEFMSLVEQAVDELPSVMGKAFRMRELYGQSTEEITRALHISKNNLWVLIHRAKQLLRQRIGDVWFGEETTPRAAA